MFEPDKVYRAKIVMKPFAHCFEKGHRIGLYVRSDWFPAYERNLNTGERINDATRMLAVQQSVYHNKIYPSALQLHELRASRREQ